MPQISCNGISKGTPATSFGRSGFIHSTSRESVIRVDAQASEATVKVTASRAAVSVSRPVSRTAVLR